MTDAFAQDMLRPSDPIFSPTGFIHKRFYLLAKRVVGPNSNHVSKPKLARPKTKPSTITTAPLHHFPNKDKPNEDNPNNDSKTQTSHLFTRALVADAFAEIRDRLTDPSNFPTRHTHLHTVDISFGQFCVLYMLHVESGRSAKSRQQPKKNTSK